MARRDCRADARSAAEWRALHLTGRPGKIVRDPDVRAFIDESLARLTFVQLADACRERFGAKRAPSKSAIHRYWLRTRATVRGG